CIALKIKENINLKKDFRKKDNYSVILGMETKTERVVIVGGGFAGVNLLKKLANDPHFEVILVDKNNYHFFPPLIYQVSTAFIENSNISYPFRRMFQSMNNVRFHMGSLVKVDAAENTVETTTGTLHYDYLVRSEEHTSELQSREN